MNKATAAKKKEAHILHHVDAPPKFPSMTGCFKLFFLSAASLFIIANLHFRRSSLISSFMEVDIG
jgi:hypothetical protein